MTSPPLSVLLPAYNAERYVEQAVASILGQSYGDFELLIVDDGSTDGTRDVLQRLAEADSRIRLVSRPNLGLVASLNEMMDLARGGLLARMDADDIAEPDRFERQVEYLRDHPECVMVGSRVLVIDPDGAPLRIMGDALAHDSIVGGLLAARGQLVYHPSIVIRAEAARAVGGYRPETFPAEDLDLFLRLAEIGALANLDEPLLRYREHLGKVGHVHARRQGDVVRSVLLEAHRRLGSSPPESVRSLRFEPVSTADRHRTWAWWALGAGHLGTARKHARAALARRPLSPASWRLIYCAQRGR